MSIVVDASTVISCILGESTRSAILYKTAGEVAIAPESISLEIGNASSSLVKRGLLPVENAVTAFEAFERMQFGDRPWILLKRFAWLRR